MKRNLSILLMLMFLLIPGCHGNNPQGRITINGEVTLDGAPLTDGSVEFASQPGNSPSITTGAPVKNGKFSIPAAQGLMAGQTYSVKFRAIVEVPETKVDTGAPMTSKVETRDLIPPKYGSQSKETLTVEKGKKHYTFNLTTD
ncbi:MAG: hypothetical protein LBG58_10345 [Planctomycetaceae bacterium]|nr:hypothetical protein [Planctomycetaceae bacterium]